MEIERRFLPVAAASLRAVDENGKTRRLVGHTAVFNSDSGNLGGFIEQIAPGAFRDAIPRSDIRALFNHDASLILGRMKAGTLKVEEDERGLFYDVDLPDTTTARDLAESVRRGDVDGNSFSFVVEEDRWEKRGDQLLRTVVRVKELFDVGPVTYPAYAGTTVSARSLERAREQVRGVDWERFELQAKLRGYSL